MKKKNVIIIVLLLIVGVGCAAYFLLFNKKVLTDDEVIAKYHKEIKTKETYVVNDDLNLLKETYDEYKNYVREKEIMQDVSICDESWPTREETVRGTVKANIVNNSIVISFSDFENLDDNQKLDYLNSKKITIPINVNVSGKPLYLVNNNNYIYVITDKKNYVSFKFHYGDYGEVIKYKDFIDDVNNVNNTYTDSQEENYVDFINYINTDGGPTRNHIYGLTDSNELYLLPEYSATPYNDDPYDIEGLITNNANFVIEENGKIKDKKTNKYLEDDAGKEIVVYCVFNISSEDNRTGEVLYIVDVNMNVYSIKDYISGKSSNKLSKENFKLYKFVLINGKKNFLMYDENGKRVDLDETYKKQFYMTRLFSSHSE